ncbi:MAG: hypothetical protein IJD55_03785 [Clostridia bacterium]|nr:hypothetical protein [Clostridia bacterium]
MNITEAHFLTECASILGFFYRYGLAATTVVIAAVIVIATATAAEED